MKKQFLKSSAITFLTLILFSCAGKKDPEPDKPFDSSNPKLKGVFKWTVAVNPNQEDIITISKDSLFDDIYNISTNPKTLTHTTRTKIVWASDSLSYKDDAQMYMTSLTRYTSDSIFIKIAPYGGQTPVSRGYKILN